jgi:hypothetical protein
MPRSARRKYTCCSTSIFGGGITYRPYRGRLLFLFAIYHPVNGHATILAHFRWGTLCARLTTLFINEVESLGALVLVCRVFEEATSSGSWY